MCGLMRMMEKHEREVRRGFLMEFRRMNWGGARVWGQYGVRLLEMRSAHREECADCRHEPKDSQCPEELCAAGAH
jgi:hypothetical protein